MYYITITKTNGQIVQYKCGFAESRYGALCMTGDVEQYPWGGPDKSDKIIIPFHEFSIADMTYREEGEG